jgi:hypothetical protein
MYLVIAFIMQLTWLGEDFCEHSYESCSSVTENVDWINISVQEITLKCGSQYVFQYWRKCDRMILKYNRRVKCADAVVACLNVLQRNFPGGTEEVPQKCAWRCQPSGGMCIVHLNVLCVAVVMCTVLAELPLSALSKEKYPS